MPKVFTAELTKDAKKCRRGQGVPAFLRGLRDPRGWKGTDSRVCC